MTAETFAAALIEDVPIGYWVKRTEVLAALSRAMSDDLAERDVHTKISAEAERVAKWERDRAERLEAALQALEKASSEVSRRGAETGPQWTKLTVALLQARAALKENSHE